MRFDAAPLAVMLTVMLAAIPEPVNAEGIPGRPALTLTTKTAEVSVDLAGGSIVDFHILGHGLNPLTWNHPAPGETDPATIGHFLCFDRWGNASEAELANGMPFHGEAWTVNWDIIQEREIISNGVIPAVISCTLPMSGYTVSREMRIYDHAPVLLVRETITNTNDLGQLYNMVQHATLGPPFLDGDVLFDISADYGYTMNGTEPVLYWPNVVHEGRLVNLRRLGSDQGPGVTSWVPSDERGDGWATASNPARGLLIGYLWNWEDYPWLITWRNVRDGRPAAYGFEFGTTGTRGDFGQSLGIQNSGVYPRPLVRHLDAGASISRDYTAFLAEIPDDWAGVGDVISELGAIEIIERGESGRIITLEY